MPYSQNMRSYKIFAAASAAFALASCAQQAGISGKIEGAADSPIEVRQLDVNVYTVLDTIKTGADGSFKYKVPVKKGQPEFIYLFKGDKRIAALLLEAGEKAVVEADTLGNYSITGSEGSAKLAEVDKAYADFIKSMLAASGDGPKMAKAYLDHYRASVKYVMSNPYSMTTIPVLYENIGEGTSVFNQPTDALFFRAAADSLKTVYPESRYVKALDKEASRRMKILEIDGMIRTAEERGYPDITLPDINGEKRALSSVDAKVVMLHFWNAEDAAQKMLNIDTLLPVWKDYHSRGFEIYAVCVSPDKAAWGSIVNSQKLPWINLNDGLGAASPAVVTYGVTSLPNSLLIIDGQLSTEPVKGAAGLRKVLDRELGRK